MRNRPTWYIYGLAEGEEVRYVGISVDPRTRYHVHIWEAKNNHRNHRERWLLKLYNENRLPRMVILECGEGSSDGEAAEKKWIAYYRRRGNMLVNSTDGGDGSPGYTHSEETRKK